MGLKFGTLDLEEEEDDGPYLEKIPSSCPTFAPIPAAAKHDNGDERPATASTQDVVRETSEAPTTQQVPATTEPTTDDPIVAAQPEEAIAVPPKALSPSAPLQQLLQPSQPS